jgi:hypothetical protein
MLIAGSGVNSLAKTHPPSSQKWPRRCWQDQKDQCSSVAHKRSALSAQRSDCSNLSTPSAKSCEQPSFTMSNSLRFGYLRRQTAKASWRLSSDFRSPSPNQPARLRASFGLPSRSSGNQPAFAHWASARQPTCASLRRLVELNGIEPMTSCLQSTRSPN